MSRLTRFAPAPTGFLHLGHVVNAMYVWDMARDRGARVLLRIEDHDAERCRPEYERAILDDLDWLAFVPDVHPTSEFRAGACGGRQSDRHRHYEAAAKTLSARGLVYGCECSRQQLAAAAAPVEPGHEIPYPGTCRDKELPLERGRIWRVRIPPGNETFHDLLCGPQAQEPASQCGDLVIRDRLGNWTYQFVATVDDWLQGIDLVVRGRDLLSSTGRQILLARMLGRERPAEFAHHPLVMKSPAQKLSKSDRDTGVRDLRAAGWSRERVLEEARRLRSAIARR